MNIRFVPVKIHESASGRTDRSYKIVNKRGDILAQTRNYQSTMHNICYSLLLVLLDADWRTRTGRHRMYHSLLMPIPKTDA